MGGEASDRLSNSVHEDPHEEGMCHVSSKTIDTELAERATRAPSQDRTVARMLDSAEAAAATGDYANALEWLRRLDAMGHQLEPVYEKRRERWRSKMEAHRVGPSQWFG
jgi:hypothetical protein